LQGCDDLDIALPYSIGAVFFGSLALLGQDSASQHHELTLVSHWSFCFKFSFHMYIPDEVIFQLPNLLLSVDNKASI
jgi:hypothetical protein